MSTTEAAAPSHIEATTFTRYADVVQALRHPGLVPIGSAAQVASTNRSPHIAPNIVPHTAPNIAPHSAPHSALHAAVQRALTPAALAAWRDAAAAHAQTLVNQLPDGAPVDLVGAFAEPWSLELALRVTDAPRDCAKDATALARRLYLAAANACDGRLPAEAGAAAAALAQILARSASKNTTIADVQTFVALTQTLPALLAGAWRVLINEPVVLAQVLSAPARVVACVGELLRLGSPARAVFREAGTDVTIAQTRLARGDTVALLLAAANRDPTQFQHPQRLDLARDSSGQLGLGTGLHHCAGALLVRMALRVGTEALLTGCSSLTLAGDSCATVWRGGFSMRSPASLTVLRRRML